MSLFHRIEDYNPLIIIIIVSFIGTLLSVPVLFEILLGTYYSISDFQMGRLPQWFLQPLRSGYLRLYLHEKS